MGLESIAQVRLEPRFKPDLHQYLLVGKNILAPNWFTRMFQPKEPEKPRTVPEFLGQDRPK